MLASVYVALANARERLSSQAELSVRARARTVLQSLNYNGTLTTAVVVAHNNAMAPQRRARLIMCATSASARTYNTSVCARARAIMHVRTRGGMHQPRYIYIEL